MSVRFRPIPAAAARGRRGARPGRRSALVRPRRPSTAAARRRGWSRPRRCRRDVAARLSAAARRHLRPEPRPAADHGRAERHARQLLRRRRCTSRLPAALARARALAAAGADILDIGGEVDPPRRRAGAADEEIARVVPVIAALRAEGFAAADLDRHPQRRGGARRLRRRRRPPQRRLGADPRPGEPRRWPRPPAGRSA